MEEIDLKWLESAIKEKYNLFKLISGVANLAVADGDNYVSKVYRLKLQALTNDQQQKEISIILKRRVDFSIEGNMNISEKLDEAFNKEYSVYSEVLSNLNKYLISTEDILWADCLAYLTNRDIYFEDLKASEYELANRLTGLDYNHCLLVFQSLAKLHASSALAIERKEIDISHYQKYLMFEAAPVAQKFKSSSYAIMVDVIRKDWGSNWNDLANKLEDVCEILPEKVVDIGKISESRINVLNHGDSWTNNMMFKYNSCREPISLRFVDFQLTHYNSFGCDLTYFLSTSVDSETKKKHIGAWIEAYCKAYASFLSLHGSSLPLITPDMVRNELRRLAPFSLHVSMRIRPMVMALPEDSMPISELLKDTGLNSRKRLLFTHKNFTEVMEKDIPYLLNIIKDDSG